MHVRNDASLLVTDGSKALFLKNEGDSEFPVFRMMKKFEIELPQNRDLRSDAPGRVFSSHGGSSRRSSYDESDAHEQAEERFVENLADFLDAQRRENAIKELVLVAPPRTLGALRRLCSDQVVDLVTAEIAKDLVKHPIGDIEQLLSTYPEHA